VLTCCNTAIFGQIVIPPPIKDLPLKPAYTDLLRIIKQNKEVACIGDEEKMRGDIQDHVWNRAAVLLALHTARQKLLTSPNLVNPKLHIYKHFHATLIFFSFAILFSDGSLIFCKHTTFNQLSTKNE